MGDFHSLLKEGKSFARRKYYFMSLIFIICSIIICFKQINIFLSILAAVLVESMGMFIVIYISLTVNEKEFKTIPSYIVNEFVDNFRYSDHSKRIGLCKYGLVIINPFTYKVILFDSLVENKCYVTRNPLVNVIYIRCKVNGKEILKFLSFSWFEKTYLDEIINKELENYEPIEIGRGPYLDKARGKKRVYKYSDDISI